MIETLNKLKATIDNIEVILIDLLAAVAPWFAPVFPAYLAYINMTGILGINRYIAGIGSAVIELLGLSTVHTVFWLWNYNDTARKSDQKMHGRAPVTVSILMSCAYLLIVLTVNVVLDLGSPVPHVAAKALLTLISVPAAVTVAIRSQHKRRLMDISGEKNERQLASQLAKAKNQAARLQAEIESMKANFHIVITDRDNVKESQIQMQGELARLQGELARLQDRNRALQEQPHIPEAISNYGRDLLQLVAGNITAVQVAERHGISESTVSRDKARLNGGGK